MRFQIKSIFYHIRCLHTNSILRIQNDWKPNAFKPKKVFFNWEKIKSLRGYEKIDLFRDYARTVDTENSLKMYMIMKENDLLVRLTYIDHHKMFHLLLKDKQKYRQDIINLWSWLKSNKYYPSVGLYRDMFTCYKTWKDLYSAKELYKEMASSNLQILPEIHEIMLTLYLSRASAIHHLEGVTLWNQIKDTTKLNPKLVGIAIELFGKLKMTVDANDLLEKSCFNFPHNGFHELKLKVAYLGALIHAQDYEKAVEFFQNNFQNSSWIVGNQRPQKAVKEMYHMMMKLCYKTSNLELAEKLVEDMETDVTHEMKCRLLVIIGLKKGVSFAEDFYNSQVVGLDSLKVLSSYKLALLEVYTTSLERAQAEKLYSSLTITPFTFYAKTFLEKMYIRLGETAKAEHMAQVIQAEKLQSAKESLDERSEMSN